MSSASRPRSCCSTASFRRATSSDRPAAAARRGFQEIGLPFESDTAVTRHLAAFLSAHGDDRRAGPADARPVQRRRVQSRRLPRRACSKCSPAWAGDAPAENARPASTTSITPSPAARPTTAGPSSTAACAFAAARPARTTSASKPPAWRFPARRGRCGPCASCRSAWKKGPASTCRRGEIGLVVGEPAHVPLLQLRRSQARQARRRCSHRGPTTSWPKPTRSKPRCRRTTTLDDDFVPVRFQSQITELGVFELWCVSTKSDHRWKLEFSVRKDAESICHGHRPAAANRSPAATSSASTWARRTRRSLCRYGRAAVAGASSGDSATRRAGAGRSPRYAAFVSLSAAGGESRRRCSCLGRERPYVVGFFARDQGSGTCRAG